MPDVPSSKPSMFRTPGGLDVLQQNPRETRFVYREIFEDRIYLKHGITLPAGSVVVDAGANIGLFAVFVQETCPGSRVIAIEPSPPTLALLEANTARYGAAVQTVGCGVSDTESTAIFTHYPDYSIMSGFHADAEMDVQTLKAGIRNQWRERFPKADRMDERVVDVMLQGILGKKQTYTCRLRPLSAILKDTGVDSVTLLKIDTEGSELQVLAGISEEHWPAVAQIVIEVHDAAGDRTSQVLDILTRRGFTCEVEEESALRGSGVVNCYARRV